MKFNLKIFGAVALASALVCGHAIAGEGEFVPNVMMIKVPAADGKVPSPDTWQDGYKVEFIMLKLENLPMDEQGQIRGEDLAKLCAQRQVGQTITGLDPGATYDTTKVPAEVQTLFKSYQGQSMDADMMNTNWYSYRSFRNNFGIYGYGHHPHYGYYGTNNYYPYYGVYYNGRTFGFTSSAYPYYYSGSYYYPYYRRW